MGQVLLPKHFASGFGNPKVAPPENLVEIDWSHPFAKNLLFYSIGMRDLVGGKIAQPVVRWGTSNSGRNHGSAGFALESHHNSDGGFVWENCIELARLDGTKFITISTILAVDQLASNAKLFLVPNAVNDWVDPFVKFSFEIAGAGRGKFNFQDTGGSDVSALTVASNFVPQDGKIHHYSISKNDTTTVRFYKDGALNETIVKNGMDDFIGITGQFNIYAMVADGFGGSGGLNGRSFMRAVWGKDFDVGEHILFHANPYAMLRSRVPTLYYFPAAAGGPLNLNRISSMHFMRDYEPISMGE